MSKSKYKGTIDTLFANAAIEGVVTLTKEDMNFFAPAIRSAHKQNRITCKTVEGGFQYRLVA